MNKTKYAKAVKYGVTMLFAVIAMVLFAVVFTQQTAYAEASDREIDYTFEDVPVESIDICADGNITEIKPGESFSVNYFLNPWYTTTDKVYFDFLPFGVAEVLKVSTIKIQDGQASGNALIEISQNAVVGSTVIVTATANGVMSNKIELTIAKIPVEQIKLSFTDSDDKLHIGKSKQISCEVLPKTASNKNIRYELSGSGMQYVKNFDSETGIITAVSDISSVQANSTITVTAFAEDDPSVSDSIVLSLYVPTIDVELSASTPLGGKTADNMPLAVASSTAGETVQMSATVNGVDTTGLNYVIVKGREYIENGLIRSDGSFTLKSTSDWTASMKQPHAEIRVRAAYSDGFDEIGISIYVPVEQISFIDKNVPSNVENNRSYWLGVQAFPEYATFLNDCLDPFIYTLNGIDSVIATVNSDGLVSLPKSLTSKGNVVNYTACLNGAWTGVDASPLNHAMSVVPVLANDITSVVIKKNGVPITDKSTKVLPDDILNVEVEYDKDNVTELAFTLVENSVMLSTSGGTITIADIAHMIEDNPYIPISLEYVGEKKAVTKPLFVPIYVPAITASITQVPIDRDVSLDLRSLVTINGHGHASDKTITWGDVKIGGVNASGAYCTNGILNIDSKTTAGTEVTVMYHTKDNENWEKQVFTVASLSDRFTLTYSKDGDYAINTDSPQLEEGHSVGLLLAYNGMRGKDFGLTYSLESTNNATLSEKSGSQNSEYDEFTLTALSNQSGRSNYIEYLIKIRDGNTNYYVGTQSYGQPSPSGSYMNRIAIFNRINGAIGVSNNSIENGGTFVLSGWDELATFNEGDLAWSVNGNVLSDRKLDSVSNAGFVLKISAKQTYNNSEVTFSTEIAFVCILYKNESDGILKCVYKKDGVPIAIEGSLGEEKENNAQTGWSTTIDGAKDYAFGSSYNESADLTLYAYWKLTHISATIGSEFETEDFLPTDFCDWRLIDTITVLFNSYTSVDALKEIGYSSVTISINFHLSVYGDADMYLQIYDATAGKELSCSDMYHSPNGASFDTTYTFTFDIADIDDTHEIQFRFKGRRYVAIWGGGFTLSGDRNYSVQFK